jgi:peptide-methionine (S)-S-oxide reductase
METQIATFGAGCFWGVEELFRKRDGVIKTEVGYTGGNIDNPTYEQVCADTTGHAEAVQVTYDPEKIKYEDLLKIFWENHDPTQLNRQGPDTGRQYRSAIFFHTPEQKEIAEASLDELKKSRRYEHPIVTEISPASSFWRAEEYHQQYLHKRGEASCHI